MSAFEFEGHEALIAQLQAGTLDAPDHLKRRVLALKEKRPRVPTSPRRKVFIAVAVGVTLALGAAVVQGAFFTSSNTDHRADAAMVTHGTQLGPLFGRLSPQHGKATYGLARGPAAPAGPTGAKGPTGANGATGAKGATGAAGPVGSHGPVVTRSAAGPVYQGSATYSMDSAAHGLSGNTVVIPSGRLIHAAATLQVLVANHDALTQATNDARQIVSRLGGYAQSVQYQYSREGEGRAYLQLHVPLGKTSVAIDQLGALGELTFQQISTEDLERQFKQQTSTIGRLQRQIAIYVQALQSGTLTGAQRLHVQLQLSEARRQVKATKKARVHTVTSGHTSDIQLNLATKQHHGAAAGPHKTGRLGQMLHNVGAVLAVEGIVILYILIIGLPLILVAGLIWWFTRGRRQRDEKRLLAST